MVPWLSSVEGLCSSLLWTACLSLLVFLFYWRGVASFTLLKAVPIPGPRQWPYIGNLPDVIKYGGMHSMLWEYFQRYGRVYKMGFGRRPTIVITDPEMIKQITIKEFPKFQNRWFPEVNSPMSSFLFIAKNDQWKRIRTTLSPTFSATKLKEVIPLMNRLDYQPLFGEMSPHSSPSLRGGSKTGPGRRRKSSLINGGSFGCFDRETHRGHRNR